MEMKSKEFGTEGKQNKKQNKNDIFFKLYYKKL